MHPALRTLEILLLIVLPLLAFYLRSNWSPRKVNIYSALLPVIWYITYAPIHEFSHMLGCFAVGTEITDYRLFAHFWEGNFGFAYVEIQEGYSHNISSLIILIFPYLLDLISVLLGYYIFRRYSFRNSFIAGLLFMLLFLRPLYDIIDNYIGFFYNHSDLVMVSEIIGYIITFGYGILTVIIAVFSILYVFRKYKGFPAESYPKPLRTDSA